MHPFSAAVSDLLTQLPSATTVSVLVGALSTAFGLWLAALAIYIGLRHIRQLESIRDDISTRVQKAQDETEHLREETLAALQLHRVIVTNPKLEHSVQAISSNFCEIDKRNDELQTHVATRDLEHATDMLRMGAEGHITIGPHAFSPAAALASILLDHTGKGDAFWASSLVLPAFWENAAAYFRQQVEAINDRHVKVHRVFVFDSEQEYLDSQAQEQMRLQAEAGIVVKYVVKPPYAPQDLVVVQKRFPPLLDDAEPIPDEDVDWQAVYAMQCRVGGDKLIDHVDLWSTNDVQSEMVKRTWWALQAIFERAQTFEPTILATATTNGPSASLPSQPQTLAPQTSPRPA
jgi:hypothetical protein